MPTFTHNSENFLLDGEKFTIVSGTIHYFRVVEEYWEDRLKKLKACGFNTVETYTCWNLHERKEGSFDFTGRLNIAKFLEIAKQLDLYVILRPGPYICSEWEMGGLPSWLLSYSNMRIRCNDQLYLEKVRNYYTALFNEVRPYLCTNGGNILMVQIENEYGSYGDDKDYLRSIAQIYHDLDVNCELFTSDGACLSMLGGGTLDEYLATINFGSSPTGQFDYLKWFRPGQPSMCAEYWNGWFDHWYEPHHTRDGADTAKTFDEMLSYGASVNFYMLHGGTNFGFTNGANCGGNYEPTITSYDYDAPISECGDITPKYYMVKEVIEKHFGPAPDIKVENQKKLAYGDVKLTECAPLFDNLDALSNPIENASPLSMEEIGQDFGYILYSTEIKAPFDESQLYIENVHDRAHIFVNGEYRGLVERSRKQDTITLSQKPGEVTKLDILVENMGRVNYGPHIYDRKGIVGRVALGGRFHFGWTMRSLPLDDLSKLHYNAVDESSEKHTVPAFYRGKFNVSELADTFLRIDSGNKGVAFINGFNLGRYFNSAGPQKTLYIPAPLLREGENELVIFETDTMAELKVTFCDKPDLG